MTLDVVVTTASDGTVEALRRDNFAVARGRLRLDGLELQVVRLFERWLSERGRSWRRDELTVFGSLLHRALLQDVWSFVTEQLSALAQGQRLRLQLVFPSDRASHLATIPWEYLYAPAVEGTSGYFLGTDPRMVLSRYMPSWSGIRSQQVQSAPVRMLVVVSQPDDARLGDVLAGPVVDAVSALPATLPVSVDVLEDPTLDSLEATLTHVRPHVLHFMGHGRYLPELEEGQLALLDDRRGALWLSDRDLAELMRHTGAMPRLVLLHSCDGAKTDYQADFAGLAPQLVRAGVQCVVAMQYPVTNRAAIAFSTAFYRQVSAGHEVDAAVQEGRWRMAGLSAAAREPQLIGVPVVYLASSDGRVFEPLVDQPPHVESSR